MIPDLQEIICAVAMFVAMVKGNVMHPVCRIEWVDDNGNPTPDTNESVGYCYREAYTSEVTGAWSGTFHYDRTNNFPICEAHRQQIKGHATRHWVFVPWAT